MDNKFNRFVAGAEYIDKMNKYSVSYRDEFVVEVDAKDANDAIIQAEKQENWKLLGELHQDFLIIQEI